MSAAYGNSDMPIFNSQTRTIADSLSMSFRQGSGHIWVEYRMAINTEGGA